MPCTWKGERFHRLSAIFQFSYLRLFFFFVFHKCFDEMELKWIENCGTVEWQMRFKLCSIGFPLLSCAGFLSPRPRSVWSFLHHPHYLLLFSLSSVSVHLLIRASYLLSGYASLVTLPFPLWVASPPSPLSNSPLLLSSRLIALLCLLFLLLLIHHLSLCQCWFLLLDVFVALFPLLLLLLLLFLLLLLLSQRQPKSNSI